MEVRFTTMQSSSQYYEDVLILTLAHHELPGVNAAPTGVWFECERVVNSQAQPPSNQEVYDPQYHDIVYIWSFGDNANATPRIPLNIPDAWKNLNIAYGRRVAHVFNDPGIYTVCCYAFEPETGRYGYAETTVTICDPAAIFPTTQTIIYDPAAGAWTQYPGARIVTTWASAISARNALGATYARILIAPGLVIEYDKTEIDSVVDAQGNNWGNMRVGAADPAGPSPTIRSKNYRQGLGQNDAFFKDNDAISVEAVFYGIDFKGQWDAAKEKGPRLRPLYVDKSETAYPHLFMLHRCKFDGFEAITTTDRQEGIKSHFIASETHITNWQNFGLFTGNLNRNGGSETALVGCSVVQKVTALSGGAKNGGFYNEHGPLRDMNSDNLFISVCDFFSRNGWSTGGTDAAGYSVTGDQACLRLNTGALPGKFAMIERIACEGSIWLTDASGKADHDPVNFVFDKVLQSLGPRDNLAEGIIALYGGTTFRNFYAYKHNLPEATSNTFFRFIAANDKADRPANSAAGIRVYNSTFVDDRDETNSRNVTVEVLSDTSSGISYPFDTEVVENNILYLPRRSVPEAYSNTLDMSTPIVGFTTRHQGPRINFLHIEDIMAETVPQGGSFTVPYSQITTTPYNIPRTTNGEATDQAYWQAIESIDTLHQIQVELPSGFKRMYFAADGDFTVSFETSGVQITNTSDTDWIAGRLWRLQLDRSSLLPDFDFQYDVSARNIPVPRLSHLYSAGLGGLKAYDDFFQTQRPLNQNHWGAFLPSSYK